MRSSRYQLLTPRAKMQALIDRAHELLARVSQFANALKAQGIKKGDRVCIYMPMTPEQRKANTRLGLILATVAATFFVGFFVRIVVLGG